MGSKTPAPKEKKETCEVCSLKFLTFANLRCHQSAKHPELKNRENSPAQQLKSTKNNTAPTPRVSKRIQVKKGDVDIEESNVEVTKAGKQKTKFKCPKCDKIFLINFQALKHIQKKHCEDAKGNPVLPDSPDIIKPVIFESCNKYVDMDTHKCPALDCSGSNAFYCLGCKNDFVSLVAFHKHVIHVHNVDVDNMFFKTSEEFEMWKKAMETIVKMKYLSLNKDHTYRYRYYTCNYVSLKNTYNTTYLCPSMIMSKMLESGIQISYNKTHCKHPCPNYTIPQEFEKYLTNKATKQIVKDKDPFNLLIEKKEEEEPQKDLYEKFLMLMHNVSRDAAKVSTSLLQKLFDSAFEMQAIINSYDEDENHDVKDDIPSVTQSMTDDQITNMLEGTRASARLKRKSDTRSSVDAKKVKVDVTKSKSESKGVSKENKEFESPKVKPKPLSTMSPSFNDSYKQFLDTTEPKHNMTKNKLGKRKEIVKTKIGQFSPKKKSPNVEEMVEKKNQFSPMKKSPIVEEMVEKKNQFSPMKKSPIVEEMVEKKNQFSPKKKSPIVEEVVEKKNQPNILKPVTNLRVKEFKYEVREQENDCNILVLKI